jgi:carbamoyl-phosphate synthase large subunit
LIDDERLFIIAEALKRGYEPEKIHDITKIDNWFLYKFKNIVYTEKALQASAKEPLSPDLYIQAKNTALPTGRSPSFL